MTSVPLSLAIAPVAILAQAPNPEAQLIRVERIELTGNTVFSAADLADITTPVAGLWVPLETLQGIAQQITQRYRDAGYVTSSAVLVNQTIGPDGIVRIQVVEKGVDAITVEGTTALDPDYVRDRVALGVDEPLRITTLETQLRLLRRDPLLKDLQARLQLVEDRVVLIVTVDEAKSFGGSVSLNNDSPAAVGSEQVQVTVRDRNLTGAGDSLTISHSRTTTSGAQSLDIAYQRPLNPRDGTITVRGTFDWTRLTQPPLDQFDITGDSQTYEITYRQPLQRTLTEEFALSAGFKFRDGQTFLLGNPQPFGIGPDEAGVSRTTTVQVGADYLRRDRDGLWLARSQFTLGLDLFDATTNDAPTPDGRFVLWSAQVQRAQFLGDNHLLLITGEVQLTLDSLLSAEQFIIGGGQTVRGYRQNARSADNGLRLSVEDRITIERDAQGQPTAQLIPFMDLGTVWNHPENPNLLTSPQTLFSTGVGFFWELSDGLTIRLDYAIPLIELRDRGNNAQDEGFFFEVNYGF